MFASSMAGGSLAWLPVRIRAPRTSRAIRHEKRNSAAFPVPMARGFFRFSWRIREPYGSAIAGPLERSSPDGKSLNVGGSNNTLTVKGSCASVNIGGADNKVVFDKIGTELSEDQQPRHRKQHQQGLTRAASWRPHY